MPAPKENRFWMARSSHGRNPLFKSPELLWDASCEYFQWCEDHPLYETKAFAFQGVVTTEELPKMRAMTIFGLCSFLDICEQTLSSYGKREDFIRVVKLIKDTVYQQKFVGAAADLLNSNIIARDLGLSDKKDLSSSDGTMTPKGYSPEQYKSAQGELNNELKDLD